MTPHDWVKEKDRFMKRAYCSRCGMVVAEHSYSTERPKPLCFAVSFSVLDEDGDVFLGGMSVIGGDSTDCDESLVRFIMES